MRISDWSSDVCSSDLCSPDEPFIKEAISRERADLPLGKIEYADLRQGRGHLQTALFGEQPHHMVRSEEHTSELQSLMRISSAVFCLKIKISTEHMLLRQLPTNLHNTAILCYRNILLSHK